MAKDKQPSFCEEEVVAFLRAYPDFFSRHPELCEVMQIPERPLGENLIDFQRFAINALQKKIDSHQQDRQHILDMGRMARKIDRQVRESILALLSVHTLDDFLQCLCQEVVSIFDVDVVRLGIESELNGGVAESYYPEEYYSGLVLLPLHLCRALFPEKHSVLYIPSSPLSAPEITDFFFHECRALAQSVLLLLLPLPHTGRFAALGLGSRTSGRFQAGQGGAEMIHFFAEVVALLLDRLLYAQEGVL